MRPPLADDLSAEQTCTLWVECLCISDVCVNTVNIIHSDPDWIWGSKLSWKDITEQCQPALRCLYYRWSSSQEQVWKSWFHFELDDVTESFNASLCSIILLKNFYFNHNLFTFPKCDALMLWLLWLKISRIKILHCTRLWQSPGESTETPLLFLQTPPETLQSENAPYAYSRPERPMLLPLLTPAIP